MVRMIRTRDCPFSGRPGEQFVAYKRISRQESGEKHTPVDIDAGGQTMSIDFTATIEGDSLEGFLSMEYGEANITGKKRKAVV